MSSVAALARQHGHLAEKQRVAFARLDHPLARLTAQLVAELLEQLLAFGVAQRLEHHGRRVQLAPAPTGVVLE